MSEKLPTVILPGYLASSSDYADMAKALTKLGSPTYIVPIQWYGWVPTIGDKPMTPILKLLRETVDLALAKNPEAAQVNLVGHSAGGWISRLLIGDQPYYRRTWNDRERVATLITLGTPHVSKEKYSLKNMTFVNETYPGAFYKDHLRYVCVAGKSIYGQKGNFWQNFTYSSYEMTIGCGTCWGDGITPVESAHLEGAENITLEGILHSPRGGRNWYGSPEAINIWSSYLQ